MAGLMAVTAFLSMWINNSAATNIMIPTALAIVNELKNYQQAARETAATTVNDSNQNSTDNELADLKGMKCPFLAIDKIENIFWFAAPLQINTCPVEQLSLLDNVVVVSSVQASE